jgi:two-component system LytT family response regulator
MNCIIIDDELHCRESLELLITRYCPELTIRAMCGNASEGIQQIREHRPELIFLDIAMPGMNGFDMLKALGPVDLKVIFTTAYNEYALDAFRVNAMDYLMKPVGRNELKEAVQKVNDWFQVKKTGEAAQQIEELLAYQQKNIQHRQFSIPTAVGIEMLVADKVLYCLSEGNYSRVCLTDGTDRLISKNLKYLEEKLEEFQQFIRIHHSSIVNKDYIKQYVKGMGGYVIMQDGKSVSVSKQRKKALLKALH